MTPVSVHVKSTQQILESSNHILLLLYSQSQKLRTIQGIIDRVLDVETNVAALKNGELTIITAKSTLATQVRYQQRLVLNALRKNGMKIRSLKIKIQPLFSFNSPREQERLLTTQSASHLLKAAEHIKDEALSNALLKLSRRAVNN